MIGLRTTKQYLDGKQVFDLWIEMGSIRKVVRKLNDLGFRNPRTGNVVTAMGAWGAAWLFVFDNLDYAKGRAFDGWKFHGVILEDEVWNKLVLKEARYLYSNKRFDQFLATHPDIKELHEKSCPTNS